jgi:hypothetical protein
MPARRCRRLLSRVAVVGVALALLTGLAPALAAPALAAPATPTFSATIDRFASYEGQILCDPTEKPGVAGFRALVRASYTGVNTGGIVRSCDVGGRSEHKEGRAWDWMLRADLPADKAKADDLLTWLLARDAHGHDAALARRLGIMYIIWNRQVWNAWAPAKGWQPYTGASPHTDHIHFSFSWDGALKRTSWWTGGVPTTGPSPVPDPKDPFGALETVSPTTSGTATAVRAVGWAMDDDAATFTSVQLRVGSGAPTTVLADRARALSSPDAPAAQIRHGFDAVLPAAAGTHTVCATALNQGTGKDRERGCRQVTVVAAPQVLPPAVTTSAAPAARITDDSCPDGRVPPAGFRDTANSTHRAAVDCAVWWKVARGSSDTTFTPGGQVTRGQIASLLARTTAAAGVVLPPSPPNAFDDDNGGAHELAINQMAALGIVQGRGGRTYSPDEPASRAQMATYLVRAYEHRTGRALPLGSDWFTDDDGSAHETSIGKAARAGFTGGTTPTTFGPSLPTARGQATSFLTRMLDLLVESGWAPDPA